MGNSAISIAAPFKGVMKQIAEVTVGAGGAASIDFQNIPAEYTHLMFMGSVRSEEAAVQDTVYIRFNGDAGANYTFIYSRVLGDSAWTNATGSRAANEIRMAYVEAANSIANAFSPFTAMIPNYANTNKFTAIFSDSFAMRDRAADNDLWMVKGNGYWEDTSAVDQITISLGGGDDIAEHSVFTLYGIKEDPGGMNGPGVSTDGALVAFDGTTGRKLKEGSGFVDRGNPATPDFDIGNLITDGTTRDLDLSGIIPVGTKAVVLHLSVRDGLTNQILYVMNKGNTNFQNVAITRTQINNISNDNTVVLGVDADRKSSYNASNTVWTICNITVGGWFF